MSEGQAADEVRTFTTKQSAKMTRWTKDFCQEFLDNPWMRPGGAPVEGLTSRDLTLLAAAKTFRLNMKRARKFFVANHRRPHLDGAVVVVLLDDGQTAQVAPAENLVIHGDIPRAIAFFDNRELLARLSAIEPPPLTLF